MVSALVLDSGLRPTLRRRALEMARESGAGGALWRLGRRNVSLIGTTRTWERKTCRAARRISQIALHRAARICYSRRRCDWLCSSTTTHRERRITKLRFRLVRVLYFALGGRGRLPTNSWPLVNRICEPCVSVFDPPQYVAAVLKRRGRVSEKLGYGRGERRSLPPLRAHRQATKLTMPLIGQRPRRSFRITPRCQYG